MSRFFKALEQAERDAAQQRGQAPVGATPPPKGERVPAVPAGSSKGAAVSAAPTVRSPGPPAGVVQGRTASAAPPAARRWIGSGAAVDPRFVSLVNPTAPEAEQYRALRHVIERAHRDRGLTVLAVSSAAVGDGKTVTAINLAGALAQDDDARILLVDADLRRPSIAEALPPDAVDVAPPPGLVDAILDARLRLDDVIQARPFNLSLLLAGGTPEAPYELLKSPRFPALLDEARSRYDYVVLDAPPLIPIPDCRIIERLVDGLLIVVRADRTPRKLLEEALDVVDPEKVLGLVFNGDEGPRPRYYTGHRYGYGTKSSAGRWTRLLRRNGARGLAEDSGRLGPEG